MYLTYPVLGVGLTVRLSKGDLFGSAVRWRLEVVTISYRCPGRLAAC
jgi:hypothetical protein